MLGFLIKVPAVPLHTWLPDAHVEAPTPISMILAALLLKMGGYGIFRVAYPLFPDAAKVLWLLIAIIGVVSIIYGGLCAMGQTDFKKLVAYSSVSHMGFVTLGAAVMTPAAVNGAPVHDDRPRRHQRHDVLHRRRRLRTRPPPRTGPLRRPRHHHAHLHRLFHGRLLRQSRAAGLCGFVGEVMVLLGAFGRRPDSVVYPHFTNKRRHRRQFFLLPIAPVGHLLLRRDSHRRVYALDHPARLFGPEKAEYKSFPEVDEREIVVLTPLAIMAVLLGVLPMVFLFIFTDSYVKALFQLFT